MAGDKLGEAPKAYDKADQDRTRRLIEKALRQPPAAGTIEITHLTTETITQVNPPRRTVIAVTGSIGNGAVGTGSFNLGKPSAMLLRFAANHQGWIRLYATDADRVADAGRLRDVDPAAGLGVLGEFIINTALVNNNFRVAPIIYLINSDTVIVPTIYYAVTNDSGSSTTFTLTLSVVDMEP